MLKLTLRIVIVLAALVALLLALPQNAQEATITAPIILDAPVVSNLHLQQVAALDRFFAKHKCVYKNSEAYVEAAETNGIDYRLLPVLSVVEESCGLHNPSNNQFGYYMKTKDGMVIRPFASIAAGINFVASEFANNKFYKGLPLKTQLRNYNSVNPNYYNNVVRLMTEIKP